MVDTLLCDVALEHESLYFLEESEEDVVKTRNPSITETSQMLRCVLEGVKQAKGALAKSKPTKKSHFEPGCFCARLRGLPWSASTDDIREFFSDCRIVEGPAGVLIVLNH